MLHCTFLVTILSKPKLYGFNFPVIFWVLRTQPYDKSVLITLLCASYAVEVLLANCYVDISKLIAKVNSSLHFNFCITIIILYLSKIRGILQW